MEVHGIHWESIEFQGTAWNDMHWIHSPLDLLYFSLYACALHSSQMSNRFREEGDLFLIGSWIDFG